MSLPRELVLVRHGESTGNVARAAAEAAHSDVIDIDRRDPDVPLTELGRKQAEALAGEIDADRFDQIWSSPYVRARQTALIALQGQQPLVDERLRDRELGTLDRLTKRGVAARYPSEAERRIWIGKLYYRPPGGESWADVVARLRSWLRDLPPDAHRVLVFCHDAPILLLRYILESFDETTLMDLAKHWTVANGSITTLTRDGDRWQLRALDQRAHLGALTTVHSGD